MDQDQIDQLSESITSLLQSLPTDQDAAVTQMNQARDQFTPEVLDAIGWDILSSILFGFQQFAGNEDTQTAADLAKDMFQEVCLACSPREVLMTLNQRFREFAAMDWDSLTQNWDSLLVLHTQLIQALTRLENKRGGFMETPISISLSLIKSAAALTPQEQSQLEGEDLDSDDESFKDDEEDDDEYLERKIQEEQDLELRIKLAQSSRKSKALLAVGVPLFESLISLLKEQTEQARQSDRFAKLEWNQTLGLLFELLNLTSVLDIDNVQEDDSEMTQLAKSMVDLAIQNGISPMHLLDAEKHDRYFYTRKTENQDDENEDDQQESIELLVLDDKDSLFQTTDENENKAKSSNNGFTSSEDSSDQRPEFGQSGWSMNGMCAFLSLANQSIPQILTPEFRLQLLLPFLVHLFRSSNMNHQILANQLLHASCEDITVEALDVRPGKEELITDPTFVLLQGIITFMCLCPHEQHRQSGYEHLMAVLGALKPSSLLDVTIAVITTCPFQSVKGLFLHVIKDELHRGFTEQLGIEQITEREAEALAEEGETVEMPRPQSVFLQTRRILDLLLGSVKIEKESVDDYLLQNDDLLIMALNMFRYLLVRDKKYNYTHIWDMENISTAKEQFLSPLNRMVTRVIKKNQKIIDEYAAEHQSESHSHSHSGHSHDHDHGDHVHEHDNGLVEFEINANMKLTPQQQFAAAGKTLNNATLLKALLDHVLETMEQ